MLCASAISAAAFPCSRSRTAAVAALTAELLHYESAHAQPGKGAGAARVGSRHSGARGAILGSGSGSSVTLCRDSIPARSRPGALPSGGGTTGLSGREREWGIA